MELKSTRDFQFIPHNSDQFRTNLTNCGDLQQMAEKIGKMSKQGIFIFDLDNTICDFCRVWKSGRTTKVLKIFVVKTGKYSPNHCRVIAKCSHTLKASLLSQKCTKHSAVNMFLILVTGHTSWFLHASQQLCLQHLKQLISKKLPQNSQKWSKFQFWSQYQHVVI